ncbi:UDP-N-acetylglucosamine 2-epimerase [compost metagenome]
MTLRDETEWVELVERGVNVIAGASPEIIASAMKRNHYADFNDPIYGDGKSAAKIVELLLSGRSMSA